jgi:hypothetical protein
VKVADIERNAFGETCVVASSRLARAGSIARCRGALSELGVCAGTASRGADVSSRSANQT